VATGGAGLLPSIITIIKGPLEALKADFTLSLAQAH
jgi:hypothetical protein